MFGGERIRLDRALLTRARDYASRAGYSSVEELITHLLEREIAALDVGADDDEVKKRLKGLGYLS
jgi:hypothetical protein